MSGERTVELFSDARKRKRPPPKATQALVERWAMSYVNRYYAAEASVRATLERRIRRSCDAHHAPLGEALGWADEVIGRLREAGVIDDARWARDKARALADRGVAVRSIAHRLRVKGLADGHIEAAIAKLSQNWAGEPVDPAFEAAVAYAKRRRFGPFCRDPDERQERFQKQLAAMARAGHSYGVARRILDAADADALLDQQ
ncbi:MAG: RecX family transcriptional regulator [Myxococcales bacterium]|nr:RecX family transcriptional regulator [Myxococcales bacterium]